MDINIPKIPGDRSEKFWYKDKPYRLNAIALATGFHKNTVKKKLDAGKSVAAIYYNSPNYLGEVSEKRKEYERLKAEKMNSERRREREAIRRYYAEKEEERRNKIEGIPQSVVPSKYYKYLCKSVGVRP